MVNDPVRNLCLEFKLQFYLKIKTILFLQISVERAVAASQMTFSFDKDLNEVKDNFGPRKIFEMSRVACCFFHIGS